MLAIVIMIQKTLKPSSESYNPYLKLYDYELLKISVCASTVTCKEFCNFLFSIPFSSLALSPVQPKGANPRNS